MTKRLLSHAPWVVAALFIFLFYGPLGEPPNGFNSDTAIAWMMANSSKMTPFDIYYYGQNRLGSCVVFLSKIVARLFSHPHIPDFLIRSGLFFYVIHLFTKRLYSTRARWFIFTVFSLLLLSDGTIHKNLFSMPQPYLLQFMIAFIYAYTIRSAPFVLKIFLAACACWISPTSVFYLAPAEALLFISRLRYLKNIRIDFAQLLKEILCLTAPLIGFFIERSVNNYFLNWMHTEFLPMYPEVTTKNVQTLMVLDFSQIENGAIGKILHNFIAESSVIPATIVAIFSLTYAAFCCRKPSELAKKIADNPATLGLIGIMIGAFINLVFVSASVWVKLNEYPPRYLTAGIVICFYVGSLMSYHLVHILSKKIPIERNLLGRSELLSGLTSILLLASFSYLQRDAIKQRWTSFKTLQKSAASIADLGPTVILGGYWSSYIWQGLEPSLRAVPTQDQLMREFRNIEHYREAHQILYCHGGDAPSTLKEYGRSWAIERANALIFDQCKVSVYKEAKRIGIKPILRGF